MVGWYYLHENGELIFKRTEVVKEPGGFVVRVWTVDPDDRMTLWRMVVEALGTGKVNLPRVAQLALKYEMTAEDLCHYLVREKSPTNEQREGVDVFLRSILGIIPEQFWQWMASHKKGAELSMETLPAPALDRVKPAGG